jgi:3-oxoacyl-[acyl-carrier-protein] synthase III
LAIKFLVQKMVHAARIISTGSYVPERVLTNSDLEKMVDTSDEWISTRTGMKERRIAGAEEFTSDMGSKAATRAMEKAGVAAEEIDLIVVATLTPDYVFPSTACLIQTKLGAVNAAAFDFQAACSGFLYGLSLAKAFIESGRYRTILFIASEKLSSITDYRDRNTCVLFGDGAAACIIRGEGKGFHIRDITLGCDGNQAELLIMPGGGVRHPATHETVDANMHYIKMSGNEVFKNAVRRMEAACKETLEKAKIPEDRLAWLVPHQANIRIIEAMAKRFGLPMEKVYITLHKYGNTSSSSCGIALDEFLSENTPKIDEPILLAAFGAGLTWGAGIISYGE